jgi:TPR repeat protein
MTELFSNALPGSATYRLTLADTSAKASKTILAAAKKGVLEAQVALGQILLNGQGIQRDQTLAVTWFRIAAAQRSAMAHNMLGRCLEHGWGCAPAIARAAAHYQQACTAGLDWGQYNYANLLATGRGVAQNLTLALNLYRLAAEQGHAKSMNLLGRCYEEGLGVASDPDEALRWYRRSACAGDFRGQHSLAAVLAAQGQFSEAESWLRQALANGNLNFLRSARTALLASAQPNIRQLAVEYYCRAAELGDTTDRQLYAAVSGSISA